MRGSSFKCDRRISLPSKIDMRCLATAPWPGWGRASCKRRSKAAGVPLSASRLIAPATSATRDRRLARRSASPPTACIACVPLSSASPSFACSSTGFSPARRSASRLSIRSPSKNASPSPIKLNARCASGARSPLAPTEPFSGITGETWWFNSSQSISMISRRIPLKPRVSTFARSNIIARASGSESGLPMPQA